MRLALISDVHANLEALTATFADMSAQAVDRVVCLGDIVGYNTRPSECIALLRDSDASCVAGGHDLAVCGHGSAKSLSSTAARAVVWTRKHLTADDVAFLRRLPLKANIDGKVLAVHGALHPEIGGENVTLDSAECRKLSFSALIAHPSGARICAFGRTHRAGVYEFRDGEEIFRLERKIQLRDDAYYLINPGSVGEPRFKDRRSSYMVLDLARRMLTVRYVAYDAAASAAAKRKAGLVPRFGFVPKFVPKSVRGVIAKGLRTFSAA
jgi:predicted phosphodiesterase